MNEVHEPPFWLVWDPMGHRPSHQHSSEQSASAEAERLAREHPGHSFYVLEPISVTVRQEVTTKRFTKVPF